MQKRQMILQTICPIVYFALFYFYIMVFFIAFVKENLVFGLNLCFFLAFFLDSLG